MDDRQTNMFYHYMYGYHHQMVDSMEYESSLNSISKPYILMCSFPQKLVWIYKQYIIELTVPSLFQYLYMIN